MPRLTVSEAERSRGLTHHGHKLNFNESHTGQEIKVLWKLKRNRKPAGKSQAREGNWNAQEEAKNPIK